MAKLKKENNSTIKSMEEDVSTGRKDAVEEIQTMSEIITSKNKKTEKKDDMKSILLRMTSEEKEFYKSFFGARGFNLSQGIKMCMTWISNNTKNGTLVFDKSGIELNRINDLLR